MEMERNGTYVCRVTRVNNEKTDYLGTLTVDEEYTIRIEIKEVERKCFDKIKDAPYTNIVINWEGKYITIVDCQLTEKAFRGGPDINNTKMYLKYISSLLLVDYLCGSYFVYTVGDIGQNGSNTVTGSRYVFHI